MKIKYFRFLYYGRKKCLLHFGEVEDTRSDERVTFLYVDGKDRSENYPESDDREISYPVRVDYLILGEISDSTRDVLEEILKGSEVDTLVFPKTDDGNSLFEGHGIGHLVELAAGTENCEFRKEIAGWRLRAASLEKGSVVLLHGLTDERDLFEDCVMNVSFLDGAKYNGWWEENDRFAAAMRCTIHHDYDACRHQNAGEDHDYLTETLLYGNTHLGECLDWIESCEDDYKLGKRLRFLELPTQNAEDVWDSKILSDIPNGHKRYYVCAPEEPSALAVSQICRKNPLQVLNVTGEGTGISCAGFLKYTE